MKKKFLVSMLSLAVSCGTISPLLQKEVKADVQINASVSSAESKNSISLAKEVIVESKSLYGVSNKAVDLKVDGVVTTFKNGVFSHAPSTLKYNVEDTIKNGFNTFITYIGVDNSQDGKGDVSFKIESSTDGETWDEIKTVDSIKSSDNAVKIQVKLNDDVKFIRTSTDTNGVNHNDHAVYGDILFVNDEYFNIGMPEGMKPLDELDKELNSLTGDAEEIAKNNSMKIMQREFIDRVGIVALENIYRSESSNKEAITFLFTNENALRYFIECGEKDIDDSYEKVLDNFAKIYYEHKNDLSDDFLLKLAISTSCAFGDEVYFWASSKNPQDVVSRYNIYKEFASKTGEDWSWSEEEINDFKNLSVSMMKYTVNSRINNDEMKMMTDYMNNYKNGSTNGDEYVDYVDDNKFNQPQYYGAENFQEMDNKYHNLLSKYNVDISNPENIRYHAVMEIDGVCGAIAKTFNVLNELKGRPASTLNQPGHAAALMYTKEGLWEIQYDISGWAESKDEMKQMPLNWGMKSWNQERSASYILLTQDVIDDKENFTKATLVNILGEASLKANDYKKAEEYYYKALEIQPNNLDSAYGLIQSYLNNKDKVSSDYLKLEEKIIENFKYYPMPMVDLVNLMNGKTAGADTLTFDIAKNQGLEIAYNIKEDDHKQYKAIKSVAEYLLYGENKEDLAKYVVNNEGHFIVLNDKYSATKVKVEYSLDNGENWTPTYEQNIKLKEDEINKINENDDIKVRLVGANDNILTINIEKAKTPSYDTIEVNDLENKFIGDTENLQYKNSNGEWVDYTNLTTFPGMQQVTVKKKAVGNVLESSEATFNFTADIDIYDREYMPLAKVDILGASSDRTQDANNVIDGSLKTTWKTNKDKDGKMWVAFEFDEKLNLHSIDISARSAEGILKSGIIYTSEDGKTWVEADRISGKYSASTQRMIFNNEINTRYLKIEATETHSYSGNSDSFALSNVAFYLK